MQQGMPRPRLSCQTRDWPKAVHSCAHHARYERCARGVTPLSPVVGLVLGTLLAAHLLVPPLVRGVVSLLAIFLPPDRADRAERILHILHGQRDVPHGSAAPGEPAASDLDRMI